MLRTTSRLLGLVGLLVVTSLLAGRAPAAQAATGPCTAPATDYGSITSSVTVPAGTATATYRIWTRMAATDTTNDHYLLEIDGSTTNCFAVGGSNAKAVPVYSASDDTNGTRFNSDSSNWINTTTDAAVISVSLPAGTTTFKMIGDAPGVVVDRVIFTQDTSCIPTGTGDNCAQPPDTTPPVGAIASPATNSKVTNPDILVAATDDTGVQSVDIYDGSTKLGSATLISGVNANGTWKYTWNTSSLAVGSSHVITAQVSDGTNAPTTTSPVTLIIKDTSPPTAATVTNPDAGTTVAGVISLAASAMDNVAPLNFNYSISGPTNKTVTDTVDAGCKANAVCTASTTLDTTTLADGSYTVTVTATDADGNTSAASTPVSFTVDNVPNSGDTTAPTIKSVSLANNTVVSTDLNVTSGPGLPFDSDQYAVSVVASDNSGGSGLKQVSVQVNNNPAVVLTSGFNFKLDLSTLAMNGPAATCTNKTPHLLKIIATDKAGNTSPATIINFYATKRGDLNDDCHSDFHDLSTLAGKYNPPNNTGTDLGRADTNQDGVVDFHDLSTLAGQLNTY